MTVRDGYLARVTPPASLGHPSFVTDRGMLGPLDRAHMFRTASAARAAGAALLPGENPVYGPYRHDIILISDPGGRARDLRIEEAQS